MSGLAAAMLLGILAQTPYAKAVETTPGLVGYWRFEEPNASLPAVDWTGNDSGSYNQNSVLGVPGFEGADGGTAYAVNGATVVLALNCTAALEQVPSTVELWMRVDDPGDTTVNRSVFRQTDGSDTRHWYFALAAGTDATRLVLSFTPSGSPGVAKQVFSSNPISPHVWHLIHLLLSEHQLAIYVDGAEEGHLDPSATPPQIINIPFYLGSVTSGAYTFDELAIYSRLLTPEEMKARYTLGAGITPLPSPTPSPSPNAFTFGCSSSGARGGLTLVLLAALLIWGARRRS